MGVTREGIVEQAQWVVNDRNSGGTYDPNAFGYPWRIVLHTIEGSANPSTIAGHPYPPHLWYDPPSRRMYQTVPLGRSAFALYQAADAPYLTNRARALQVEIAGFAAQTASWPQEWLDNITNDIVVPLCQWVAQYTGASIDLSFAPDPGPIPGSARADAAQRVAPGTWALASGLYSHRHVPMGDDHWDTGGLDTPRIAAHARLVIGGLLGPATPTNPTTDPGVDDDMLAAFMLPTGDTVYVHNPATGYCVPLDRLGLTLDAYNGLVAKGLARPFDSSKRLTWEENALLAYMDAPAQFATPRGPRP
jgi:hypothetical protein